MPAKKNSNTNTFTCESVISTIIYLATVVSAAAIVFFAAQAKSTQVQIDQQKKIAGNNIVQQNQLEAENFEHKSK